MTGKEILQRLGYDNSATTANEYIIAKEAYDLARTDAAEANKTAIDPSECHLCSIGACPYHF
jgi:hypothetical protein